MKNFYDFIKDKVKFCEGKCNTDKCFFYTRLSNFWHDERIDCLLFKKELKHNDTGCISYYQRTKKCRQYFGE